MVGTILLPAQLTTNVDGDTFVVDGIDFGYLLLQNSQIQSAQLQVLEILIAKADTEIAELEDDIVMLQSQLARTDEKWLDMCIAALNKKIDRLGSLITALKIENVQTSGVHLQTNKKPLERIHDILETPPRNFSSPRDKQADDSTIVEEAVKHIQTMQHTFINLIQQKLERLMGSQELPNVDISWELNLIQQKLERLMGLKKFPNVGISLGLNLIQQKLERLMGSKKLPNVGISWEQFLGDQGSTSNSAAITPTSHGDTPLLMNMNNNNIPTFFKIWNSPNVTLNVCGEDAHISVCCPKKPELFSFICHVLEKHKIEIVSAQTSSDQFRSMFMIQAHAKGGSGSAQFSEASTVEEMFRQAATEIMAMATPK